MGWYWAYALIVAVTGILIVHRVYRELRLAQQERLDWLEKLRRFDAVRTESPIDNPVEEARRRALGSVETRFSIIRAIIIPGIIFFFLLLLGIPVLSELPATILSLLVALLAVVTGIAAKPPLENLIAGVVISLARPFRIGDTVLVYDHFGTVEDISISHTIIKVWDWRRLMVPNSRMLSTQFINYSIVDRFQWAYVEFWVATTANLHNVEAIATHVAKESTNYAGYEEPRFWVMELGREGIRCWIAAWADTPSAAWQLSHDIRTKLAMELQSAGIPTHIHRVSFNDAQDAANFAPLRAHQS